MIKRNLLDLRLSERLEIARQLDSTEALGELASAIEQTLLSFKNVTGATEEQIYLFGLDMRQLLNERPNKDFNVPSFRSHINEEIQTVFAGGFIGLDFAETLAALREKRDLKRLGNLEAINRRPNNSELRDVATLEASLSPD
jgi:hypothetical protein